jgi:phosphocarrier protein HPr
MVEKDVVVTSDAGIHARPAMMLVKEAMKYPCSVTLIKGDVEADCKSIMSVLSLAIVSGTKLKVRANGDKSDEAVTSVVNMIESGFNT